MGKRTVFSLIFIFSIFLFSSNSFTAKIKKKKKLGIPSKMVRKLFLDLKYNRFSNVSLYSTGTIAKWINDINKFLLEAPGKKIRLFKLNFSRLYDIRIYDEYIKGKYAFVQSLWISKSPPNTTYKYKIRDQIHLLEKKNGRWYLRNYKFQGEHYIHDIDKVRRIQKKAREMDRRRGRYRRYRGRRRYRYYRYRR